MKEAAPAASKRSFIRLIELVADPADATAEVLTSELLQRFRWGQAIAIALLSELQCDPEIRDEVQFIQLLNLQTST